MPIKLVNIPEQTKSKKLQDTRYLDEKTKNVALKNLSKKYKNRRQNSLLTIATGTTSRYYNTTRQTDNHNRSIGKQANIYPPIFPIFQLRKVQFEFRNQVHNRTYRKVIISKTTDDQIK